MNRRRRRHLVAVLLGEAQDDVPPIWSGVGGIKHLEVGGRRRRRKMSQELSRSFLILKKAKFQLDSEEEEEEEVEAQSGHHRAEPVEGTELRTHHHLAQVPAEVLADVLQGGDGAGPGKTQRGHVRWATASLQTRPGEGRS